MEEISQDLPSSWIASSLKEACEYIQRGKSPKYTDRSELPVINQKCVRWNGVDIDHVKYIHPNQFAQWTTERFLQDKDILWNSTGTGTIGRACLYKPVFKKTVVDSHVTILRTHKDHVLPEYVFYFISSPFVQKKIEDMQSGSTNQVELGKGAIEQTSLPLAPLNEQKRIVDRIEQLFSDMDKGEELLKTVQKQLSTYRQSVLKAAVTGELTKDWREKNKKNIESGEKLLACILKARRKNWKGRGKYEEPEEPKDIYFSEIPESWVTATIDQISSAVDYGSSAKCNSDDSGVAVLRMGNIQSGGLDIENLKYLPHKHDEFPKLLLDEGDLLFNRTNSAELVGKTAIYKGNPKKCSFASYLIRVKLIDVEPEYVSAFINSAFGRAWIKAVVSQQVGQANVNGSKLKSLAIPLPPRDEQQEIVQRLENIFSKIDVFDALCAAELNCSTTLRQSILKSAFSGKLVAQDPFDEPASELLARIKSTDVAKAKPRIKAKTKPKARRKPKAETKSTSSRHGLKSRSKKSEAA